MEQNPTSPIIILSPSEEVDMADAWYEYASLDHFWIQSRFDAILKVPIAKQLFNKRLFEIGCGNGLILNQFESYFNIAVDGCDLNPFALEQIENARGKIYSLNIFDKPKELVGKYDGVLLMDVIEHIDNDALFLKTACQYLVAGGLVIINVPALNSLFSKYDVMAGHKRRYTKKMMETLFKECGIEKVSIEYWGFSMIPIAWLRKFMLMFTPDEKVIKSGFRPPNKLMNLLLKKLMQLENVLMKSPPKGTSLVAIGKINSV